MTMTLGYWDIRGLAQPVRLLMEYNSIKYEEKFYVCGEAPDYDRSSWFNEKNKLGLDFANLPYLVDGDIKIVQSNAILRYIARKHKMCGETEEEKIRVDVMENQAIDFRNGFVRMCYTDLDKMKPGYLEALPGILKEFSNFLGDRKWFAGDKVLLDAGQIAYGRFMRAPSAENSCLLCSKLLIEIEEITFVDFLMYELLDQHRMFHPTCLDDFKNLKGLLDRFEALEKIAAYMKSDKFMKTPVNNRMAKWGNKKL